MKELFTSASKIVFMVIAASAAIGLFTGHISENNFMLLATGVFGFFFAAPSKIDPLTGGTVAK